MKIYAFDDIIEDVKENNINDITFDDIKLNGISMRFGDRIVKFSVTEETVIEDDDYKKELKEAFEKEKEILKEKFDEYRSNLKTAYDTHVTKLLESENEYKALLKEKRPIPVVSHDMAVKGLSVSKDYDYTIWFLNCVYSPKYVNDRIIDPAFAKRLITPIRLMLKVRSDNTAVDLVVMKMFGDNKFQHYHSLSVTADCWGNFKFSGITIENENDAYDLFNKALSVLETINEFSIGTRNPKGLSRFDTIKKHLLGKKEQADTDVKLNTRNTRTGIDNSVIDTSDNVWTV